MVGMSDSKGHFVMFINGFYALILKVEFRAEADGKIMRICHMRVSKELDEHYKLTPEDYDRTWQTVKREYTDNFCKPMNLSPGNEWWLFCCDFEGKFIDPMGIVNPDLLAKVEYLTKENDALRKSLARVHDINRKLAEGSQELDEDNVQRMKKYKDVVGQTTEIKGAEAVEEHSGGSY